MHACLFGMGEYLPLIPTAVLQNSNNKSCLICFKNEKYTVGWASDSLGPQGIRFSVLLLKWFITLICNFRSQNVNNQCLDFDTRNGKNSFEKL